jgi:hypothetical protein
MQDQRSNSPSLVVANTPGWKTSLWRVYLACVLAAGFAYLWLPLALQTVVYPLFALAGAAGVVAGIAVHRPTHARFWWLIGVGLMLYFLGDATYYWMYSLWLNMLDPFPSWADVFYLLSYQPLIIGVILLSHPRSQRADRGGMIDAMIVTTGFGLLIWTFLITPLAQDYSLSLVEKLVSISYPVIDVLLLAVLARLLLSSKKRSITHLLFTTSLLLWLVADVI